MSSSSGGERVTARPFAAASLDELEAFPLGEQGPVWRPVRRHFDIEAFGVNVYAAANPGDQVISEHSEAMNGHEELYFVAAGHAQFNVGGEPVDAPAGTFVFVRPDTSRAAVAKASDTAVLVVGGRRNEGFEVSAWEISLAAFGYLRAGADDEGLEIMRSAVDRDPEAWPVHYNFACYESLAGREEEIFGHLQRAIELNPKARELAREDSDFAAVRDHPEFTRIVAGDPAS
jgi:quercetin dioxygenase-like cupin family protein